MADSEVTQLLRQIALEYEAAQRGLTGTATVSSHQFINERQTRIALCHIALAKHVGKKEANKLVDQMSIDCNG